MRILFIRHTEAEEAGHGVSGSDPDRRLTRKGRNDASSLGEVLELLHVRPRLILSSPYVRAMETAGLISEKIKKAPGVLPVKALEPGKAWGDLQVEVARHGARLAGLERQSTWIFAVGHQPDLGEMIVAALGGRRSLSLKKGACIGVGWEDDKPDGPACELCLALEMEAVRRILGLTSSH